MVILHNSIKRNEWGLCTYSKGTHDWLQDSESSKVGVYRLCRTLQR